MPETISVAGTAITSDFYILESGVSITGSYDLCRFVTATTDKSVGFYGTQQTADPI